MALHFKAKTEEQISAMGLLNKGRYALTLVQSRQHISKTSGGESICLLWKVVFDNEEYFIEDYIGVTHKLMLMKLRHLCEATGKMDLYNSEVISNNDFVPGMTCMADVDVQKGKERDDGGKFDDKNTIKDYLIEPIGDAITEVKHDSNDMNDDIPF